MTSGIADWMRDEERAIQLLRLVDPPHIAAACNEELAELLLALLTRIRDAAKTIRRLQTQRDAISWAETLYPWGLLSVDDDLYGRLEDCAVAMETEMSHLLSFGAKIQHGERVTTVESFVPTMGEHREPRREDQVTDQANRLVSAHDEASSESKEVIGFVTDEPNIDINRNAIDIVAETRSVEPFLARCRALRETTDGQDLEAIGVVTKTLCILVREVESRYIDRSKKRITREEHFEYFVRPVSAARIGINLLAQVDQKSFAAVRLIVQLRNTLKTATHPGFQQLFKNDLDVRIPVATMKELMSPIFHHQLEKPMNAEWMWSAIQLLTDGHCQYYYSGAIPRFLELLASETVHQARAPSRKSSSLPMIFFIMATVVDTTVQFARPAQIKKLLGVLREVQASYVGTDTLLKSHIQTLEDWASCRDPAGAPLETYDFEGVTSRIEKELSWLTPKRKRLRKE